MHSAVVSTMRFCPRELVMEDEAPSTAPVSSFYIEFTLLVIRIASSSFSTLKSAAEYRARKYGSFEVKEILSKFSNSAFKNVKSISSSKVSDQTIYASVMSWSECPKVSRAFGFLSNYPDPSDLRRLKSQSLFLIRPSGLTNSTTLFMSLNSLRP